MNALSLLIAVFTFTAQGREDCITCIQAEPQCEPECSNCVTTEQTCGECPRAICRDPVRPPNCIMCTEAIVRCEDGCSDCDIIDGTCTECPRAICNDPGQDNDCVMCTKEHATCEEGCKTCMYTQQTCGECSQAVCADEDACLYLNSEYHCTLVGRGRGCEWTGTRCERKECVACIEAEPRCEPGCKDCRATQRTCDQCPRAICRDRVAIAPVPEN